MTKLEILQKEYNEISKKGKCIADRYHQRKIQYNAPFDAIFSKIWEIEPREEDEQNPFASTNEITAKAIQAAGFESDKEIITAFHQHEEDYYKFAELDSKGLELSLKIAALTIKAHEETETPQNKNEWQFVPISIYAPEEIIENVINPILETDAKEGKGLFANVTEIETEDEIEDDLLMVKIYNCEASLTGYCEDLKRFGVIGRGKSDAFFKYQFKFLLLKVLNELATYISQNTDKPAKTKNHISKTVKTFDNMPIWGLFFQILILQGLCRWLKSVNINKGDNGYNEAQILFDWLQMALGEKLVKFCCVPYGDNDKIRLKPLCDYLYSTKIGKAVQRVIFSKDQEASSDDGVTLPEELNTGKAITLLKKAVEIGLCDNNYKWLKSKSLLAYFADKASAYLGLEAGKYFNTDTDNDENKTFWKPFETLFNRRNLSQSKRDYIRKGMPRGHKDVDNLF